jgi:glycosyltransferase involved in cell wall biosynthesis
VDIDKFSPVGSREEKNNLRKKLGLPENTFIIMFVGFFSEDKGPDILVEAYKIVKKNIKADMRVLFVGSTKGVYYEIKASLVKKIKDGIKGDCLEKDIIFVEKTLEIEEYYRCSDLFVLSSKREGLPNALLEAMASGLPCVSSNLDGVVGYLIFDEKEGMLFNSGDIHGLSRAVCRVFEDRKLAKDLGYSAREKVIKNFSIGIVAGQYKKLYEAYYRKEAVN